MLQSRWKDDVCVHQGISNIVWEPFGSKIINDNNKIMYKIIIVALLQTDIQGLPSIIVPCSDYLGHAIPGINKTECPTDMVHWIYHLAWWKSFCPRLTEQLTFWQLTHGILWQFLLQSYILPRIWQFSFISFSVFSYQPFSRHKIAIYFTYITIVNGQKRAISKT